MLERAFSANVPARWVVADSFYGRLHSFREWLEERGRPYAVMVPKTNAIPLGGRKKRIEQHVERLPADAFREVRPTRDSSGRRPWQWACLDLAADPEKGMRRWLLVRRSTEEPEELGFYQAYGPEGTTLEELVGVCQERSGLLSSASPRPRARSAWTTTRLGGGTRGTATSPCAYWPTPSWSSFARSPTKKTPVKGGSRRGPDPADGAGGASPGARDVRAGGAKGFPPGMVVLEAGAPGRGGSLPGRKTRRAFRAQHARTSLKAVAIPPEEASLTDEQWELVRSLLPPQRGGVGRPPNDHRVVLGGILWVARTGSSWREMPEEYGKWESAYRRQELWAKQALWQRILRALGEEDLPGPATKKPN